MQYDQAAIAYAHYCMWYEGDSAIVATPMTSCAIYACGVSVTEIVSDNSSLKSDSSQSAAAALR
eukprot:785-Heterococcus_DN1.PRE.3